MRRYWTPGIIVVTGTCIEEWLTRHTFCVLHVWASWVSYDREAASRFCEANASKAAGGTIIPFAAALFDDEANFNFMQEHHLTTVPTFLMYRRQKELFRVEGLASAEGYLEYLDKLTLRP